MMAFSHLHRSLCRLVFIHSLTYQWVETVGKSYQPRVFPTRERFGKCRASPALARLAWDEGVVGMKVGGIRELTIPPELAYGDKTSG